MSIISVESILENLIAPSSYDGPKIRFVVKELDKDIKEYMPKVLKPLQ